MNQYVGRQLFGAVAIGRTFRMDDKVYEKLDRSSAAQIMRNDDGSLEPLTAIHVSAATWGRTLTKSLPLRGQNLSTNVVNVFACKRGTAGRETQYAGKHNENLCSAALARFVLIGR